MAGFEKLMAGFAERIERIEKEIGRRDAIIMAHGLQLHKMEKYGAIWDKVKTDGNSDT